MRLAIIHDRPDLTGPDPVVARAGLFDVIDAGRAGAVARRYQR